MKIQDLAIIFVIIIIPISLVLSIYTQFQMQTINMQTLYDTKLTAATYDAIKAFQLNSANSSTSDLANSKLRDLEASVVTFRNSLKSAFELSGYSEEELNNYIPALVYTLYDGFYIYSPYENTNHRYKNEDGVAETNPELKGNQKADQNGENLYGLKPYISYSCRYVKGTTIDVVITYSLDNYITVQGMINDKYVNKSGYLIEDIVVNGDTVTYNGVTIGKERLQEKIGDVLYSYAKVNGTKYYLRGNEIVYFLNGVPIVQYGENHTQYKYYKNLIESNDSAQQYYKDAYDFTEWFKNTGLNDLQYKDAIDEVISDDGTINKTNVWAGDLRKIFEFNASNNIENEISSFNQHRLSVIRHKIETNLAIAIKNYNNYSGVSNEFEMPELKENEWDYITHNISLISFLQGLPIGGKSYNGYTIVTNSESKEVVIEENIYILGKDSEGKYSYHKIGDKGFEDGTISVYDGDYGIFQGQENLQARSAGRLNLDFKRASSTNTSGITNYFYPLKDYNASYNSIIMQNNVTTYDDIYEYVNNQSYDLKEAFYTALGRERWAMYKSTKIIEEQYSVLVVGKSSVDRKIEYEKDIQKITNKLNEEGGINATYIFNTDGAVLEEFIKQNSQNYNLIIVNSYVWSTNISNETLLDTSRNTNLITISNDQLMTSLVKNSQHIDNATIVPKITDNGKEKLKDIQLNSRSDSGQLVIEFNDDVEVFYKAQYSGDFSGERDLIGSWKNGNNKWIHSQLSLNGSDTKDMECLKLLMNYALNKK